MRFLSIYDPVNLMPVLDQGSTQVGAGFAVLSEQKSRESREKIDKTHIQTHTIAHSTSNQNRLGWNE